MNDGFPPTYFAYTVTEYELVTAVDGTPKRDEMGRPYVQAQGFEPTVLPAFLEGPVHALKAQPDLASARNLYGQVKASELYDRKLGMYKLNGSLADQSHEVGRARAFTPGWLENESIWLHMEYKYLLSVLKAGLYEEFFEDFKRILVPFQDPGVYGRSPLENSSFIVSSAHPDDSLHGAGFVARLSGSAAEFLSMWSIMMAGHKPFFMQNGQLRLALRPVLPGWLFSEDGKVTFKFLGRCDVTYHNPRRLDTYGGSLRPQETALYTEEENLVTFPGDVIGTPFASMIREGQIANVHVYFQVKNTRED
jgi:hypothetical protein